MRSKIEETIPKYALKNHVFEDTSAKDIYVVDWTNFDDVENGVRLCKIDKPTHPISGDEVNSVNINNENEIKITFDLFGDNALPIKKGQPGRQCECVCFPSDYNNNSWVLFIETKYAKDSTSAFDEKYDYPNEMKEQIKATVRYFKDKGVLDTRIVNAVISFPNILESYSASVIDQTEIEDFLLNYGIIIRATNTVEVIDKTDINLVS